MDDSIEMKKEQLFYLRKAIAVQPFRGMMYQEEKEAVDACLKFGLGQIGTLYLEDAVSNFEISTDTGDMANEPVIKDSPDELMLMNIVRHVVSEEENSSDDLLKAIEEFCAHIVKCAKFDLCKL